MIEKKFYFLSGLPRSGSTVLSAVLNQNPEVFVTPTSPLLDQLIENQNIWNNLQAVKANPIPDQLTNITRRLINGMWGHVSQNIIIDKNRGWGKNMPASEILFGEKIKMVATVRDLPSIMASWLVLLRKNPNNYLDKRIINMGHPLNDSNRMAIMWYEMVQDCMEAINQAKVDASDRLLLVNYDDFVNDPDTTLDVVSKFLDLPSYSYDCNNITSVYNDDDLSAWGLQGMHTIRSRLQKTSKGALEILGDDLYHRFVELEKQYVR
jgi:sulfotransferase